VSDGARAVLSHLCREEIVSAPPSCRRWLLLSATLRWGEARGLPPISSESPRLGADLDVDVRLVRALSDDPGRPGPLSRLRRECMDQYVARATRSDRPPVRRLWIQRQGSREQGALRVRRERMDGPDSLAPCSHEPGVRYLRSSRPEPRVRWALRLRRECVDGPDSLAPCSHQSGVRYLRSSRPEPRVRWALRLRRERVDGPDAPAAPEDHAVL
jgi:hypothetical protein